MYIKKQKNEILTLYAHGKSKKCLAIWKTMKEGKSSESDMAVLQ